MVVPQPVRRRIGALLALLALALAPAACSSGSDAQAELPPECAGAQRLLLAPADAGGSLAETTKLELSRDFDDAISLADGQRRADLRDLKARALDYDEDRGQDPPIGDPEVTGIDREMTAQIRWAAETCPPRYAAWACAHDEHHASYERQPDPQPDRSASIPTIVGGPNPTIIEPPGTTTLPDSSGADGIARKVAANEKRGDPVELAVAPTNHSYGWLDEHGLVDVRADVVVTNGTWRLQATIRCTSAG